MFSKLLTDYCHQLLQVGAQQLDLPVGIVGRIWNDTYLIVAISCATSALKEGTAIPLNATCCREVYQKGRTIALTDLGGIAGLEKHPLFMKLPPEAYISAPIRLNNQIWGTVSFTSTQTRDLFTEEDIQLVEGYALLIHKKLLEEDAPEGSNRKASGH